MSRLLDTFHRTFATMPVTRRAMLASIPALGLGVRAAARAQSGPALRVDRLHNFGLKVADVDRTVDFYQELFGMAVQARQGTNVWLRIGVGPQFMFVRALEPGESPAITHLGYSVPGFDPDAVLEALEAAGFETIDAPPLEASGSENAMKAWVRMRRGTPELYFADQNGLIVQLQDPSFCGGSGPLGNMCTPSEAPASGSLTLKDISHFTVFNAGGANEFYRELFGLGIQAYQGPGSPVIGVGDGIQFMMYAGGIGGGRGRGAAGAAPAPANIHHACMNLDGFEVEAVQAALEEHGIQPREEGSNATPPLIHYISLRMPNRGGVEGGTPEFYFTDPDGLLMQLQDTSYCGGGGYLGEVCEG